MGAHPMKPRLVTDEVSQEQETAAVQRQETVSAQIKRLQAEARVLAVAHVTQLCRSLSELEALAGEIAEGGDTYPAGVRQIARRLAEDCAGRAQSVQAIVSRK